MSIIIRVPVCDDVSAGVKVTETLQLFPGFRVFTHFDLTANTDGDGDTFSISITSAGPFFLPPFLIVILIGLLVVPTVTPLPNASD